MNPEVAELFHQLVDLSPEERERYLAEHPVDAETRRIVEDLLADDPTDVDPLGQQIAFAAARALMRLDAVGARCGAFRLMSVIGRGGMGVVYLAERVDGEVTQRAAVKLMHPGWSEVDRERFLQEREILASLTHPNIAHLLDAGRFDDGQPYLAMEYVEGKPIDQYCEGYTVRQKIELFLKVCAAVEYLHENLVVHRDLKPSNILLPALGEPKLLDFGIAKMLDPGGDLTATHLRMVTPNYASPEQMSGGVVGTSSDIYSLGAVLHTLLTGQPPQEGKPSQLSPEVKGDLELILLKALRTEPEARYTAVEEFAEDLRAYLDSRPIRVRQGERLYRARKFARRHRFTAALAAALAVAAVSAGGLVWYWSRSHAPPQDLRPERLTANTPELAIQAAAISPDGTSIAYSDPLGIHVRDTASGETRLLPETSGHVLVQWMPGGAGLETQAQDGAGKSMAMVVFPSGRAAMPAPTPDVFAASPDGKYRALASEDHQRLLVQDAAGGSTRQVWSAPAKTALDGFQWSPNSKLVGVFSSNNDASTLEIVDTVSGQATILVPTEQKLAINSMVWATQERVILSVVEITGVNSYNCNLWEIRLNAAGTASSGSLRKLTAWTDFPIRSGSLTTDGKRLVFVRTFAQRDVYVAEMDARRSHLGTPRRLTLELGDDYPTAWTRDSKTLLLTSDRNGPMNIFRQDLDKQTADPLVDWPGTQLLPRLAPDGKTILFCNVEPGKPTYQVMRTALGGGSPKLVAEITKMGDFRCSAAGPCAIAQRLEKGHAVFELDLERGKGREIYRAADGLSGHPDISPNGKWLAAPSGTKVILRSFSTGAVDREIPVPGVTALTTLDYAPDGKGFFIGDTTPTEARQLYVDLAGKSAVLWRQAGSAGIWGIASPDGRYLAMMMYTNDSNVYTVERF